MTTYRYSYYLDRLTTGSRETVLYTAFQAIKTRFQQSLDPQQFLQDPLQSDTLGTEFLTHYLKLPNQEGRITPNVGKVSSFVSIKEEGEEARLKLKRVDNFYFFNTMLEESNKTKFYYKEVDQDIASLSPTEDAQLYGAIQKAVEAFAKRPFDPVRVGIPVRDPKDNRLFYIEPIVSVHNKIKLGLEKNSLTWRTTVETYDDKIRIEDELFERRKTQPRKARKTLETIGYAFLYFLAFLGGVAAGGVIGLIGGIEGGPAGMLLFGMVGAGIGGMCLPLWAHTQIEKDAESFNKKQKLKKLAPEFEEPTPPSPTVSLQVAPEATVMPSESLENASTEKLDQKPSSNGPTSR